MSWKERLMEFGRFLICNFWSHYKDPDAPGYSAACCKYCGLFDDGR